MGNRREIDMEMTVSMNGLRDNLISDYNKVVRKLNEYITNDLTEFEAEEVHQVLDDALGQLRQDIGILCCVYDPDGGDKFTDMSDRIDSLADFEEFGK